MKPNKQFVRIESAAQAAALFRAALPQEQQEDDPERDYLIKHPEQQRRIRSRAELIQFQFEMCALQQFRQCGLQRIGVNFAQKEKNDIQSAKQHKEYNSSNTDLA